MKKIKILFLAIPMLFLFSSCEGWLDVNYDRDAPIAVTIEQSLPPLIFFAQAIVYDHAEYAVYLSQTLTTSNVNPRSSLAYSGGWDFQQMNRHPMWRRHFFDIGTNNRMMMDRALDEGARNVYLIGRTIRLMSTLLTVDAFGDMPHFQAFLMDINASATPRYDSQQAIFTWLFQEVEDLLDLFADPNWTNYFRNPILSYRNDLIYGGDMAKWEAFAMALRARLWLRVLPNGMRGEDGNAMQITHRGQNVTLLNTPENARRIANFADEALNHPSWTEPRFQFLGGPGSHSSPWGPSAPIINGWESRGNRMSSSVPTTFFGALLGNYNRVPSARSGQALDPRAVRMMTARVHDNQTFIRQIHANSGFDGLPAVAFPDMTAGGLGASNPFTTNTGYNALMLHEELLFIRAEAEYWSGNINAAFETTREAVLYNMTQRWGIDPERFTAQQRPQFDRFWAVRMPGAAQFTIATLMQQKHIAMYLQPEQWTDMRRYNFSSPTNGIMYVTPSSPAGIFVYLVTGLHDGGNHTLEADLAPGRFTARYALRRPANLWVAVWGTPDNFGGQFAVNSPNAWVNRLNYDPETEPRFNSRELNRIGAMVGNEVVPDWVRNRLIWQFNTSGKAISSNPVEWR